MYVYKCVNYCGCGCVHKIAKYACASRSKNKVGYKQAYIPVLSVHCLCSCIAEKADMFLLRGSGYRLAPDIEIVLLTCH